MKQHPALYKVRDFGEKINVTIEYIRYNIGPLLKIVLLIAAPVGLLFGIFFSNLFGTMMNATATPDITPEKLQEITASLMTNYLLMIFLSLVVYAFLMSGIYGYMKLKDAEKEDPTVLQVYGKILPKIPMLIVLMVLIGIVTSIGFVLFILPGIYLMVTLSLAIPVYLFEDGDIGDAFGKSFRLIKGKWWSTFALLVISGVIAMVVSYVFAIPFYIFSFGEMFTLDQNDPQALLAIFSSWYTIAGLGLMMVGSYITYMIPIIALGFQYFNLSERVEGKGIRNEIRGFETLA